MLHQFGRTLKEFQHVESSLLPWKDVLTILTKRLSSPYFIHEERFFLLYIGGETFFSGFINSSLNSFFLLGSLRLLLLFHSPCNSPRFFL